MSPQYPPLLGSRSIPGLLVSEEFPALLVTDTFAGRQAGTQCGAANFLRVKSNSKWNGAQLELIGGCRQKGAPCWPSWRGGCLKAQATMAVFPLGLLEQDRPLGSFESKSFTVHAETEGGDLSKVTQVPVGESELSPLPTPGPCVS